MDSSAGGTTFSAAGPPPRKPEEPALLLSFLVHPGGRRDVVLPEADPMAASAWNRATGALYKC